MTDILAKLSTIVADIYPSVGGPWTMCSVSSAVECTSVEMLKMCKCIISQHLLTFVNLLLAGWWSWPVVRSGWHGICIFVRGSQHTIV